MSDDVNSASGHRQRLKARYLKSGINGFADYDALELLLSFAIPRKDVKPIAKALLNKFESLSAVFEASIFELMQIEGIGEHSAILLNLVPQMSRFYLTSKSESDGVILNSTQAGEYLKPYFMYERDEIVLALCLDSKRKVICCREIGRGEMNSVNVSIRKLVEIALEQNAASVIISHNHLSGIAIPSAEDEISTSRIKKALGMVGVTLIDHIVVAFEDYVSMKDSGMI